MWVKIGGPRYGPWNAPYACIFFLDTIELTNSKSTPTILAMFKYRKFALAQDELHNELHFKKSTSCYLKSAIIVFNLFL